MYPFVFVHHGLLNDHDTWRAPIITQTDMFSTVLLNKYAYFYAGNKTAQTQNIIIKLKKKIYLKQ